jgi:tetratricopeptide (TPR) repeat protein
MLCNYTGPEIPATRLETLERAIDDRRIGEGIAEITDLYRQVLPDLSPQTRNASRFLALAAIWCDTGFGGIDAIRLAFNRFGKTDARSLSAQDLVYQQFGLGVYSFLTGKSTKALECFRRALDGMVDGVDAGPFYHNLALFYQARIHRKYGAYPVSLEETLEAERMADDRGKPLLAAVIRYTRAWVLWQKGDAHARTLLESCRKTLEGTDDELAMSAITSMLGRMARRCGAYRESVEYATEALRGAAAFNHEHPTYARYLINAAASKRLLARERERELTCLLNQIRDERELRGSVSRFVERHRLFAVRSGDSYYAEIASKPDVEKFLAYHSAQQRRSEKHDHDIKVRKALHVEIESLRSESDQHLAEARQIELVLTNQAGLGLVDFYTGLLRLDQERLQEAVALGDSTFECGERSGNPVLMSRGRLLQCLAVKACADAGMADEPHPGYYHSRAKFYGEEAVRIARDEAFHDRVLARALVALGQVYASDFIGHFEGAEECCKEAEGLLKPLDRDFVWSAYRDLREKLYNRGSIESISNLADLVKRALAGNSNRKHIMSLIEEFVVIEAWRNEGCCIGRTKTKLQMSEAKIRKILRCKGLCHESGRQVS